MFQILRTHGGYAGVSDEELKSIPYARFKQAARVAAEAAGREAEERWKIAAFVGWQGAAAAGALKKGTGFDRYLSQLGLTKRKSAKISEEQRQREIAEARANVARVAAAFGKRGVA